MLRRGEKNAIYNFINLITETDKLAYTRDYFCVFISWAIPTLNVIRRIKNFVGDDFMVGTGIWSFLMSYEGINVFPVDCLNPSQARRKYISIKNSTFQELENFVPFFNVLFISWPTYSNTWAYEVLQTFKGNKFVYIGEGIDGCCAEDLFFQELENNWTCVEKVEEHKTWRRIYDSVCFYERK